MFGSLPPEIRAFLRAESGAVAVDWVVLSAAVVGMGVAAVGSVRSGISALGSDVSTSLSSASVASLGVLGDDGYTGPRAMTQGVPVIETAYACPRGSGTCFTTTITTATYTMADGNQWTSVTYLDDLDGSEPYVIWYDNNRAVVSAPRIETAAETPAVAPPPPPGKR